MKSIFFCAVIILTIVSCKLKDQHQQNGGNMAESGPLASGTVQIRGTIGGMDSGYLELIHQAGAVSEKDSVKLVAGQFSYTSLLAEPTQYFLRPLNAEEVQPLIFFADPGEVTITGNLDSIHQAKVSGGKTQAEFEKANDHLKSIFAQAEPYYQQFSIARQSGDVVTTQKIQRMFDSLLESAHNYAFGYAKEHPSSVVAASLLVMNAQNESSLPAVEMAFNQFSEAVKKSQPGKMLEAAINGKRNTKPGAVAPDFTLSKANGQPVSLNSYRGKIVLVDFWASWCGPCRAENPNVVLAYQQYHPKGFEILGVSLDDAKENWLAAIQKDHLSWTQVSDLKGWESPVAGLYRIESIPANFLLDKEGKIIATDLRGPALTEALEKLFPR